MAQSAKTTSLYERDFYAWTQDQAEKLRVRATFDNRGDIDWDHAAEEIESLGRSQRSEIRSRLLVILVHLLKWRHQSHRRSRSWKGTLIEQRRRIEDEMAESPSLSGYAESVLQREYETARIKAAGETHLPEETFPDACPFTIDQILDPNFYPEAA
ncbi:hypothetical protein ASG43_10250 [Aureimonas sp. Leaf454]|uniref:DUF29 domain-containing protein n=1 Tax=Aureimonas sp. Leaf454 TaxID=1736381 RepID=UPI0006FB9802|nr:DUF29 domain-containing protein [Aureimonas sp. Leaf454]KQT47478.1 hypothetical protein ASG43_10250 [Aureimonas sp. Leaf454]